MNPIITFETDFNHYLSLKYFDLCKIYDALHCGSF